MSYRKPKGLLKDLQQKRITPKSLFLRKLEEMQRRAAEEAPQNVTPFRKREGQPQ